MRPLSALDVCESLNFKHLNLKWNIYQGEYNVSKLLQSGICNFEFLRSKLGLVVSKLANAVS